MHLVGTPIEVKVVAHETVGMVSVAQSRKRGSFFAKLIRQPLIHFLLAGVVLFTAASVIERNGASSFKTIHIKNAEIQRLQDVWSRQYGRNPTPAELQSLVNDYIREEIYYREAVGSGLDKEDTIIRRRLVEKMEFLSQEVADGDPDENELQAYFQKNQKRFQIPAQAAFTHIFFSPAKRGASIQTDVEHVRNLLASQKANEKLAGSLGDPFMLQSEYPPQTPDEVKALFGEEFAAGLFASSPGQWTGPIRSSYGLHLVRITQYTPPHVPNLEEVRNKVLTDFKNERLQTASEKYYASLRKRYRVQVDNEAFAPEISSPAISNSPVQKSAPDED